MSVRYTMKAIPTTINGITYRSRLEARWAAFFRLCEWDFVYEPFDMNGWAPDFLIKGDTDVLVEVKPITKFDAGTAARMDHAVRKQERYLEDHEAMWELPVFDPEAYTNCETLLVGIAPFISEDFYNTPAIGWWHDCGWEEVHLTNGAEHRFDLNSSVGIYTDRLSGYRNGGHVDCADWGHVWWVWGQACEMVKYNCTK